MFLSNNLQINHTDRLIIELLWRQTNLSKIVLTISSLNPFLNSTNNIKLLPINTAITIKKACKLYGRSCSLQAFTPTYFEHDLVKILPILK